MAQREKLYQTLNTHTTLRENASTLTVLKNNTVSRGNRGFKKDPVHTQQSAGRWFTDHFLMPPILMVIMNFS